LTWSPEWYLLWSIQHEAPCHVVLSTLFWFYAKNWLRFENSCGHLSCCRENCWYNFKACSNDIRAYTHKNMKIQRVCPSVIRK
jgi:hypothetical protein